MSRTWKSNADEFKALTVQGKDFRLCILVACSVVPDEGHGISNGTIVPSWDDSKVSYREFAERANTTHPRISRHYQTWEALADMGLIPHASQLTPNHPNNVFDDTDDIWAEFNMSNAAKEFKQYWSVSMAAPNAKGRAFYGTPDPIADQAEAYGTLGALNERVPFDDVLGALVRMESDAYIIAEKLPSITDPSEIATFENRRDRIMTALMEMVANAPK